MDRRLIPGIDQPVSALGFGAFKIGRNRKTKYADDYAMPSRTDTIILLNQLLDAGVNFIDTAPAYGLSEQRIGEALAHRRDECVLATKVGETFVDGVSTYDYSDNAVRTSVVQSLGRLRTDVLDVVWVHSNGDDLHIQRQTDCVATLRALRDRGMIKAIGMSGKTVDGAEAAIEWADAIMVEYHADDDSHAPVIDHARRAGKAVVVKKGLASGRLPADEAIRFVLGNDAVTSLVVGGLNLDHIRANIRVAEGVRP